MTEYLAGVGTVCSEVAYNIVDTSSEIKAVSHFFISTDIDNLTAQEKSPTNQYWISQISKARNV
jgi:hypothetical protein